MGGKDDLGGKVEVAELKWGKALPSPFEDKRLLIDEEPEFVLIPLLATDPLPYLFNQARKALDADGKPLGSEPDGSTAPAIRRLQDEIRNSEDEMGSEVEP